MKKRKNWKKALAALVIGSQIAGAMPGYGMAQKVFAEEMTEGIEMGLSASGYDVLSGEEAPGAMENLPEQEEGVFTSEEGTADMLLPLEQDVDMDIVQGTSLDLSSVSFQVSDIRDSSKVSTFNGADGKQAVIMFGGVKRCANTVAVLQALTEIASVADISRLNIYVFDIQQTSTEDIVSQLGSVSEQIIVNSVDNSSEYYNLYYKCYRAAVGSGGFTMPLIVYKGIDGTAYEYTTGATSLDAIIENIGKGGLDVGIKQEKQVLNVTGQAAYDEAYKVLDILNQEREKEGLSALAMDEELLEAAMLRAAECALYYSHTRPDGTQCFTASGKMSGENIAMLQRSAEEVMDSWMNSAGHRANILADSYHSVGIGCFYFNGVYSWTQCFGIREGATGEKKATQDVSYAVTAAIHLVTPSLTESSGTLTVGKTKLLEIRASVAYIDADSYEWESNSASAAVSSNGIITAMRAGKSVITGRNKANPLQTLTYTLTVVEDKVATPTIVISGDKVIIEAPTNGSTIYYTIDGSTPTVENGIKGDGAIVTLDSFDGTVKAIAVKSGCTNSEVASCVVKAPQVETPQVVTPTINVSKDKVTIKAPTDGSTIYYTVDGSTPTVGNGIKGDGAAVTLDSFAGTLKAIAVKDGCTDSGMARKVLVNSSRSRNVSFKVKGVFGGRNVTFGSELKGAKVYYSSTTSRLTTSDKCVDAGSTVLFENFYGTIYARTYYNGEWGNVCRLILKIPVVNTPSISMDTKGYATIRTTTPGTRICYTTDGTAPSMSNGKMVSSPYVRVYVGKGKTIRAIAVRSCFTNSKVATYK